MIGEVVGSYRVVSELGRGGMGLVMRAEHLHLKRAAAIKVLKSSLCDDARAVQRFLVEARATAEIQHPGIVQIYDCGIRPDGSAFIVMELLEGQNLQASLASRGPWPFPAAVRAAVQIVGALAAAHNAGVVHRDLKPENIFLLTHDPPQVKLVDFGIAKLAERDYAVNTAAGAIMGTPRTMSPEQCRGSQAVDHRSDIYSLGCVLFEMVTGQAVFPGPSAGAMLACHQMVAPPDPTTLCPNLAKDLADLILAMLAKNPAQRPSLAQIRSVLEVCSSGTPAAPRRILHPAPAASSTPTQTRPLAPGVLPEDPRLDCGVIAGRGSSLVLVGAAPHDQTGDSRASWPPPASYTPDGATTSALGRSVDQTGKLPPASRNRVPLWAALAGGVVLLVLVAVPSLRLRRDRAVPPAVAPARVAPIAADPVQPARPAIEPRPEPVARPADKVETVVLPGPASTPREQAPPTSIRLVLVSEPPGAVICSKSDGKRLGVTNATVSLRRSGSRRTLVLYKSGYRPETLSVPVDKDLSRAVVLRPLAADDLREPEPCR